jgi:hypothetical protein
MGTEGRRKVQVFSSEIVEDARMLLTQKTSEPVHDGGGDTDAVASSRGVAEKRLFIDHADSSSGAEGDKDQSNGSFGVHGEIEWAS